LARVFHPPQLDQRAAEYFETACSLAVRAARQALREACLSADHIDAVITCSTTDFGAPGIDPYLIGELHLAPTVRRIPVTQLGCAGATHALAQAATQIRAHPGSNVLIVAVELLSYMAQPSQTDMSGMILKALLGDAAGATVVRGDDRCSGMRLGRHWEYLLPGSGHYARVWMSAAGPALETHRDLLAAPEKFVPEMVAWLTAGGAPTVPDFIIPHPGGPRVIAGLASGLGLDHSLFRHAEMSLGEIGNVGGVSLLDVAARTFDEPPREGARGLLVGLGPGLTVVAAEATWQPSATDGSSPNGARYGPPDSAA
jgi:predicted naringenin-chalcone synthase